MEHPSDDVLSAYALDSALVPSRTAVDDHLLTCADCRARLEMIRSFDALLRDPASWSEEKPSRTRDILVQQETLHRREDIEAKELLRPVLDGTSGSFVWANLAEKSKYHTGGVVRHLIAHADSASYSHPLYALNVAETAVAIASMLSKERYSAADLTSWRGTAWKMRANALRHLGRFAKALESLDFAEREYRALPRPELDLAAVTFVRATILHEQEEHERAAQLAAECTRQFVDLGQSELYLSAYLLQGAIAYETRDLATAERVFRQIYAHGDSTDSSMWIARASQALGLCFIESGALDDAVQHLTTALRRFKDLGVLVEEIRCRWALARVAQKGPAPEAAISRLKAVREEFTNLGVTTDAALVTLDLMETYLMLRKWREVRRAAGNVVTLFREAGMLTGAITAANWLRHAARMKSITPTMLDAVRRYLRRVDLQPDFSFVPPTAL